MASTTEALPTVLICDDEPLLVSSLARALRRAGLDPVPVTHPEEFLGAVLRCKPDLVLLDLMQGDTDGRTLLLKMRQDPRLRGVKVLMITASIDPRALDGCLELGADGVEHKPFEDGFIARVVSLARRQYSRLLH